MWGNLSDDYSRRVITNYICKIEIDLKTPPRQLRSINIAGFAAMHRNGINFRQRESARFGAMVARQATSGKLIVS